MILALDTSTQWMGIALSTQSAVFYERIWQTQRRHTIELAPAVRSAMRDCAVSFTDLEALTIALGPGSFTSLRIGLAFIKGIALAHHAPTIGIPSLDILAHGQPVVDHPLCCIMQAGRQRLIVQKYLFEDNQWKASQSAYVTTAENLASEITSPMICCGELSNEDRNTLGRKWKNAILASPPACLRRPSHLAELAFQRLSEGKIDDPLTLTPIYIQTSES